MKRSRPWLCWLALGLCVEAGGVLWRLLAGNLSQDDRIDRSHPILGHSRGLYFEAFDSNGSQLYSGAGVVNYPRKSDSYSKLEAILRRNSRPRGAKRTRAGQLIDGHGRVLLDQIEETKVFAYSPECDLLVWETPNSAPHYGINIRKGDSVCFVSCGIVGDLQIQKNGTIWLAESRLFNNYAISVLAPSGRFLGWRAERLPPFTDGFCELNPADLAQVEAARKKHDEEEG